MNTFWLFPFFVLITPLAIYFTVIIIIWYSSLSLCLILPPPHSAAACPTLISTILRAGWSQHFLDRPIHVLRSAARYKSMIGRVTIYFATVFWQRAIYNPIYSSPTIASASPMGGYTHVPPCWSLGPMPSIRRSAWWWNPSRDFSNWGVRTHVLYPNSITACTTATYNLPSILLYASSLPKIFSSHPHLPAPSGGSVPTLANCCRWTTTFVPSIKKKRPPSAVSHTPLRPAPYAPPSPQLPTSIASSPSCASTSLKSCAPDIGPPVEKTCHTGGTGDGVDSPPPGWLCCPESVGEKSVPGGFSVRTLSIGIPPQGTSIGQG